MDEPKLPAILTPDAIANAIAGWPRNAARYINARLADPDRPKTQIRDSLGLSDAYPWRWYHGHVYSDGTVAAPVPGMREIDAAITIGTPFLRREVALEYITRHAPTVAERTVERALWQDEPDSKDANGQVVKGARLTDRRLQVSHQAGMAVLEVAGVIQKAPIIQIDNRRVDVAAMQLWQQGGAQAWQGKRRPPVPGNELPPPETPQSP